MTDKQREEMIRKDLDYRYGASFSSGDMALIVFELDIARKKLEKLDKYKAALEQYKTSLERLLGYTNKSQHEGCPDCGLCEAEALLSSEGE